MELLKKCAEIYSNYAGFDYTFTLDCNMTVTVAFRSFHFHHLIGLHYLKDITQVNKTLINNSDYYIKDQITYNVVNVQSKYYKNK